MNPTHNLSRLRAKHGSDRSLIRTFPDLTIPPGYSSLGDGFAPCHGKRPLHPDAKQFPVGHLHKQGLQLITPDAIADGLQFYGGKKP